MKHIQSIVVCILLVVPLQAQKPMSLNDCIRLAWKRYPGLKNSELRIQEARADYVAAVGDFLPRVALNGKTGRQYGRSIDPNTNGFTNETFEEGSVGLDMTLSLFEGFSRINRVRFQKINRERSEWELKEKRNELAYQVTDAYYKLILERKLLNLAFEQSRLSERYLKQTETFVELGLKSASDLQEVKARREGDLYRHRSRMNGCQLALLHLKQLMDISREDTLLIQDEIEEEQLPVLSIPETETLYSQSVAVQPTLKMIELSQRAASRQCAIARGRFFPSVYLCFSVGSNYSNTFFSSRQLRDNVGKYVGVGFSFPLLTGLDRVTNLKKEKLNMLRLHNDEDLEKQKLYTNVEQTVLSLQAGCEEHKQAFQHLKAEALVLKESERKWEEGLISVFQLMEARNRFISAKAELTRVRLEVEMSLKLEQYYRNGTFLQESEN